MSQIIFQDSFLSYGIMCHDTCGTNIENALTLCVQSTTDPDLRHLTLKLIKDAEPLPPTFGIHRLFISIECTDDSFQLNTEQKNKLSQAIKNALNDIGLGEDGILEENKQAESKRVNWINIILNLLVLISLIGLSLLIPPSVPLTISLAALSFVSTAFSARHYLLNFFYNLRRKNWANMSTTISLGWFLSLAHALYHSISMPVASFSMVFMNFIMPVLLITLINGMEEIKRRLFKLSKKMQLESIASLFPEMAQEYPCYQLDTAQRNELAKLTPLFCIKDPATYDDLERTIQQLLNNSSLTMQSKNSIKEGTVLRINPKQCIPVDSILIQGNTLVDSSLLTGEPVQNKQFLDIIPAGSIHRGTSPITVYAKTDGFHGSINRILFCSNRPREQQAPPSNPHFQYLYTSLIILGLIAAIALPCFVGVFTLPLLLQNLTGILFSICPCTIALAYQLPQLLNVYQRNKKGIRIRDERLSTQSNPIHTLVLDKTGTLTTGNSIVDSTEGIDLELSERIYRLEKEFGAQHPIAQAINRSYENNPIKANLEGSTKDFKRDPKNRGLSAEVCGKQIHIGNASFLRESGITVPVLHTSKTDQGFSTALVAENGVYRGIIYIKHEMRPGIDSLLKRLKQDKVRLIMLTGDNRSSALGFNQQNSSLFDPDNIFADRTPEQKQQFLAELMKKTASEGLWFVGDGINDTPSLALLAKEGGVSCAMTAEDKSAYFADISLNGTLDYLLEHNPLNQFFKKITWQNKGILIYSLLCFLGFIITFSLLGISLNPIIPLVIMASTTFFVVFNSFRMQWAIDNAIDKPAAWYKKLLASDTAPGLILGISSMALLGLLIATVATGGLALPILSFSAGTLVAISSSCFIAALVQTVVAVVWGGLSFIAHTRGTKPPAVEFNSPVFPRTIEPPVIPEKKHTEIKPYIHNEFYNPEEQVVSSTSYSM